ncbi:MAG TPA: hypothetical protein VI461_06920 [Chitinophagaceae bacterium]|nr:hypothetical protein [Chitinophagaceae bacterium]
MDTTKQATSSIPVMKPENEVTNQQLMLKLLELEKKIKVIEKKLTTPLIH